MDHKPQEIDLKEHLKHLDKIPGILDPYKSSEVRYDIHIDSDGYLGINIPGPIARAYGVKSKNYREGVKILKSKTITHTIIYNSFYIPVTQNANILFKKCDLRRREVQGKVVGSSVDCLRLFKLAHLCHAANYVVEEYNATIINYYSTARLTTCLDLAGVPKYLHFSNWISGLIFMYDPRWSVSARESIIAQQTLQRFISGT